MKIRICQIVHSAAVWSHKFFGYTATRSSVSVLSGGTCSRNRLFNLSCVMVFRRNFFLLRRKEKDLSAVTLLTEKMKYALSIPIYFDDLKLASENVVKRFNQSDLYRCDLGD